MKKKIFISAILVIMILSMSLMLFSGCKMKLYELDPDFAIPEAYIGADTLNLGDDAVKGGIKAIDADTMTAFEMLQVGMENFYNAYYAVNEYSGGVNMKLAGALKVNQAVQSIKIRNGVGDGDGNNANGATYFADNKSASAFAKIYEKFVIRPNSWERKAVAKDDTSKAITFIDTDKPITQVMAGDEDLLDTRAGRLGYWYVDASKLNAYTSYNSLSQLVTVNSNNPTILWMYELSEDKIINSTPVKYDAQEKCYKFSFDFEPESSTVEYLKVMQTQLENNAGMDIEGLSFNQLVLEVVMWENGMLRAINVVENYQMKMALTAQFKINSAVVLYATQLFSYNPNEELYKIEDHIAKF